MTTSYKEFLETMLEERIAGCASEGVCLPLLVCLSPLKKYADRPEQYCVRLGRIEEGESIKEAVGRITAKNNPGSFDFLHADSHEGEEFIVVLLH